MPFLTVTYGSRETINTFLDPNKQTLIRNLGFFSDAIQARQFKLCMSINTIELYLIMPVLTPQTSRPKGRQKYISASCICSQSLIPSSLNFAFVLHNMNALAQYRAITDTFFKFRQNFNSFFFCRCGLMTFSSSFFFIDKTDN